MYVCVCVFVCLFVCLLVCLFGLFAWFVVCLFRGLSVWEGGGEEKEEEGPKSQSQTRPQPGRGWASYEKHMTRNITQIWFWGHKSGSRGQTCNKNMKIIRITCANHVNLANHIIFTFFILFSYYFSDFGARNPGPGPTAVAGPATSLWGPGPSPGTQNVKMTRK
jgi:hypothetical protein